MATIVLQAAGGALGGALGGPFGAIAGRALGGLAGSSVDQRLFSRRRSVVGPRLSAGRMMDADEGAGIARAYGTVRIAGQIIWMTRFEEEAQRERTGGKGGQPASTSTTYAYFGNFAVGLCEGPIAHVRRVWADGEELDLAEVEMRVHLGTGDQQSDPVIEAKQGAGNTPAYRGLAYLVFERLPLGRFGNRIPQISCEAIRPVGLLEGAIEAVTIIPGATEHGLDPVTVRERVGEGEDRTPNRNVRHAGNDFTGSVEELVALCPRLKRAALVIGWFADDLRCGRASVRPAVETHGRDESEAWSVGGVSRAAAALVSSSDGGPAYGGTPSDAGVVRAVAALRARRLKVTFYPFLLMDVPAGNTLPDPYGGSAQASYPWRGRMTLDRAESLAESGDGTAAARIDIGNFVGTVRPEHFAIVDGAVAYSGPPEWSYRRMILQQAALAQLAGGVDAFVIGSEMRGLTRLRDEAGRFPFVEALIAIAGDVKAMLPETKITYAADWSEYFGYQPADGSGDVFYNLDPLWACAAIDMVGIDSYLPAADWRAEDFGGESPDGSPSPYDRRALRAGITGGEHADWFYASEADRRARRRTAITDGAAGKPWVYRAKDLRSWWENQHVERRGGVEAGAPTAWAPRSKPIWLTELGCAAIDKGANQPNVFVDPKSAENAMPHFSSGARDDHQQRRFLEAHLAHWHDPAGNPASAAYGGAMIPTDGVHLWTWDARPYPAFPELGSLWRDGANWTRGHWLNGRLGRAPLAETIAAILSDHGLGEADVSAVDGEVAGYFLSGPGAARGEIEALCELGGVETAVQDGRLVFRSRRRAEPPFAIEELAEADAGTPLVERRRSEAVEIAQTVAIGFNDVARAYEPGTACAVLPDASNARRRRIELPVAMDEPSARNLAEDRLAEEGGSRETIRFDLPPTALALEPGDRVRLPDLAGIWRVERIEDGETRRVEAARLAVTAAEHAHESEGPASGTSPVPTPIGASRPLVAFVDLPGDRPIEERAIAAIFARPWMPYAIRTPGPDGSRQRGLALQPATMGRLAAALEPGPEAVVDRANTLCVDLVSGALSSVSRTGLAAGANRVAIETVAGWEIIQFETADEIAPSRYRLRNLVRGLVGSDEALRAGAAAGALFVLLDAAATPLRIEEHEIGSTTAFRIVPAGRALDDPAAVSLETKLGLTAERAFSPVHLKAVFGEDGAVRLSWIRRTRRGGDRFEAEEVPLAETFERYAVSVESGSSRIEERVPEPTLLLTGAAQIDAFGALPETLAVTVRQVSASAGPGSPRSLVFNRPASSGLSQEVLP